ncbi:MAG: DUF3592 domain-containing protein [Paracoccaceae bacterium]
MTEFIDGLMAGDRASVLTAAALYAVIMGLFSIWFCFRVRGWPSVVAKLNRAGLDRFGWSSTASDQDYRADVAYSFDVDGQTYSGHRLSPTIIIASANARFLLRWQMRGIERIGEEGVRAYYKPSNPEKSYLIVPSLRTIAVVAVVMFGSAALIYSAI